jgi:predicted PurR-regulated permease PerM
MNTPDVSTARQTKVIAYLLGFISFVLFVYILMALREILIPFTIAIFLTYLFHPLVSYLRRYRVPKWVSLILIFIVVSGIYYLVGLLIISSLSSFPENMESYAANISKFLQQILSPFNLTVKEFAAILNLNLQQFDFSSVFQGLFKAGVIQNLISSFSSMLEDFFIMMIFWIFMILGKTQFEERVKIAFESNKTSVEHTINGFNTQLQSYIIIKTIISLIVAVVSTVIFLAFGIDFALIWGLLTFILNFIPNIGAFIATVAPIVIGLLEYGLGFTTISMTALLIINHSIMGNLVEPHYFGKQMDLSPVFVLFSLIFWGWIWGIVGMFLSVPIAAAMKILFSNIEPLKPVAVLMGSKTEHLQNISP